MSGQVLMAGIFNLLDRRRERNGFSCWERRGVGGLPLYSSTDEDSSTDILSHPPGLTASAVCPALSLLPVGFQPCLFPAAEAFFLSHTQRVGLAGSQGSSPRGGGAPCRPPWLALGRAPNTPEPSGPYSPYSWEQNLRPKTQVWVLYA